MGKVVKFSPDGGEERREEKRGKEKGTESLSQEEFLNLIEPLKEGLKRLYPSQVREVLGVAGFGEKNGKECFVAGLLAWLHFKQSQPILSSFLAVFVNDRLEKISFLEAKNNYWDWKLMIDTYQTKFNTKRMFEELQKLKEQVLSGNMPL
ncbi:MAG: hypothetical protein GXO18_04795 [Aquificae bacterium]|nr:hypothetical protein [Aquificota bacterium]